MASALGEYTGRPHVVPVGINCYLVVGRLRLALWCYFANGSLYQKDRDYFDGFPKIAAWPLYSSESEKFEFYSSFSCYSYGVGQAGP